MAKQLTYFLSLNSPWTYLGHARLVAMAKKHDVTIDVRPVDFAVIFPKTGGLPVPKRAPARQAYRMMELKRWRTFLEVPLNLQPAHWPADEHFAAQLVIAVHEAGGDAMALAGAFMGAVWAQERNIADRGQAEEIATRVGIDAALFSVADTAHCAAVRAANAEMALDMGVFGAPSYVHDGEVFWGQDRLEMLERALV